MKRTRTPFSALICVSVALGIACEPPPPPALAWPDNPKPNATERLVIDRAEWPGPDRLLVYDTIYYSPRGERHSNRETKVYLSAQAFARCRAAMEGSGMVEARERPGWINEEAWSQLHPEAQLFAVTVGNVDDTEGRRAAFVVETSGFTGAGPRTVWKRDGGGIHRAEWRGHHIYRAITAPATRDDPWAALLRDATEWTSEGHSGLMPEKIELHDGVPLRESFGGGRKQAHEDIVGSRRIVFVDGSAFDTVLRWYRDDFLVDVRRTVAFNEWIVPGLGPVVLRARDCEVDDEFLELEEELKTGTDCRIRPDGGEYRHVLSVLIVPSRRLVWIRPGPPDSFHLGDVRTRTP